MKQKLTDVIKVFNLLKLNADKFISLPLSVKYKLVQFKKALEIANEFYTSELRKLMEVYCERDENNQIIEQNNAYKIKEDKLAEFTAKFEELEKTEIDVDNSFALEDFGETTLTLEEIEVLYPFLKEEKKD